MTEHCLREKESAHFTLALIDVYFYILLNNCLPCLC